MTPVKGPMPPEALGPLPLRKAASDGDPAAQYMIADRYLEGNGTKRNVKKATEWLDRAARAGLAPAQYRLAAM
jgi:localization factor PodJL